VVVVRAVFVHVCMLVLCAFVVWLWRVACVACVVVVWGIWLWYVVVYVCDV
jgi:hypothetical protein